MALTQEVDVDRLLGSINRVCKEEGGNYSQYSARTISWDDAHRGTVGGDLSCWGANITDTRLWAKDGRRLFTVRPDNWDEKLGTSFSTDDICLIVGNEKPGCDERNPILLSDFLKRAGSEYGKYCGLTPENCPTLHSDTLDGQVSIRYQATFLPASELWGTAPKRKHSAAFSSGPPALEFVTEAYNYNTMSDSDPKNLVLLCTTQGFSLQQDGMGAKKLFQHSVDHQNKITRHWLEAEQAENHSVGGEQKETDQEKRTAAQRGKATSSVIGPKCLGTRFNALMTVQIPLEMKADRKILSATTSNQDKKPPSYAFAATAGIPEFKLILIGDRGVGKTSFMKRNLTGSFENKYIPTQGTDVNDIVFNTNRGPIKFIVWDIAGEEKSRGLQDCYYVQGQSAIIMFDARKKETYNNTSIWIEELTRVCNDIPIVLCGNKLSTNNHKVRETYVSVQSKKRLPKLSISVESNQYLDLPFLYLARKLSGDESLTFVEAPALCPPETNIDEATKAMYEAELALACCMPLPDEDEYDFDDNIFASTAPPLETCRLPVGTSNAARVSIGSVHDRHWKGLEVISSRSKGKGKNDNDTLFQLKRHENQHITITVILYYTVVDGVPSTADVMKAIDDLESLYEASSSTNLASNDASFMKDELTVQNVMDIQEKVTRQPHYCFGAPVSNANIFPTKL